MRDTGEHGHRRRIEGGEAILAAGPAEDAVLVLDDGNIELVELDHCPAPAREGALQQVVHDLRRGHTLNLLKVVDDPDDAEVLGACPGTTEMRPERGREGRQPAL